jgi:hypothetical protein
MTVPLRETVPEVGLSSPARRPRRVDLPEPEAPMMAANSPRAMEKSIPLRISTVVEPVRRLLRRSETTIIALLDAMEDVRVSVEMVLKDTTSSLELRM